MRHTWVRNCLCGHLLPEARAPGAQDGVCPAHRGVPSDGDQLGTQKVVNSCLTRRRMRTFLITSFYLCGFWNQGGSCLETEKDRHPLLPPFIASWIYFTFLSPSSEIRFALAAWSLPGDFLRAVGAGGTDLCHQNGTRSTHFPN